MRRVGKLRTKLAEMIESELKAIGIVAQADPSRLHSNRPGRWQDILRWEGYIKLNGSDRSNHWIGSWERMSECVKAGIILDMSDQLFTLVSERDPGCTCLLHEARHPEEGVTVYHAEDCPVLGQGKPEP